MKILHVYKDFHPNGGGGGVARHIDGLVKTLNPDKYLVRIAALSAKDEEYLYPIYKINYFSIARHLLWCDILHIHGGRILISGYAAFVAFFFRKKVVYSMHCYYDDSPFFKKLQKKIWDLLIENQLLSHVHSLILPSLFWRDYLLNRDIPLDNLTIIPNCVSLSNLSLGASAQEKNELTNLAGFPSLLYVGRLDPVKRVEDLILVLKEDGMSGGVLHVVGIGPSLEFLKDFAKKCRVDDRVIFYGFVEDSGVQNLVDKVDIFVLASLQEGMPTVLMEMILRRCRVVASSIPGNLSVLNPLELKTVFLVGNIKSLRDAILGCMSTSISDDQVKKAKELFTWEENIHKIEAIYDGLLVAENQSA